MKRSATAGDSDCAWLCGVLPRPPRRENPARCGCIEQLRYPLSKEGEPVRPFYWNQPVFCLFRIEAGILQQPLDSSNSDRGTLKVVDRHCSKTRSREQVACNCKTKGFFFFRCLEVGNRISHLTKKNYIRVFGQIISKDRGSGMWKGNYVAHRQG